MRPGQQINTVNDKGFEAEIAEKGLHSFGIRATCIENIGEGCAHSLNNRIETLIIEGNEAV